MNGNEITPPATPSVEYRLSHADEVKKPSFWISQIFILLATVLGVYLASSQGFEQAMNYGNLQAARNNYYLRKSLRSEIDDNLALVDEYLKRLETGGLPARKAPFALDTFVWESMKNSPSTMEAPPELLREARMFYRGVADIQQKVADNTYSVKTATERLNEMTGRIRGTVLQQFDADIDALGKRLRDNGMDL